MCLLQIYRQVCMSEIFQVSSVSEIRVSEICMFMYMRYIWVYVWGMCVGLWCLRSVPKPDTEAEVLSVIVYIRYKSVQVGEICMWYEWIKIHVYLFVDLSDGDRMYSVVTGFYGCSHGNLFVWMYPCELVCVDDVFMGTGLCGWCIYGNWFVWMVYGRLLLWLPGATLVMFVQYFVSDSIWCQQCVQWPRFHVLPKFGK